MKHLAGTQTTLTLLVRATQCSNVGAIAMMESVQVCSLTLVRVALLSPPMASVCAQLSSTLICDFALKTLLSAEIKKWNKSEIRENNKKYKNEEIGA